MQHELVSVEQCPICLGKGFKKILEGQDHNVSGDFFSIKECESCTFRITTPRPSEATIGEYYKTEDYISHSDTQKGLMNKVYHIVRERAIKQKESLVGARVEGRKLLDIGCGTGTFLSYCKDKGWETLGLEPSSQARDIAQSKYGVTVRDSSEMEGVPDESMDAVTMWHVLEHVYDLNEYTKELKRILKDDGVLVVAVPNCSSYDATYYKKDWAAYDLPIHLQHFRPENMKALFAKVNMAVEEILPMYFDAYYVSMLSEKYRGNSMLFGLFRGFVSNMKASNNRYSSQIYIIKKKR